ncbi:MAG: carboxypeptidase-like regulatory domain-containing protein [Bacteroidia bacterium]
MRTNKTVVYILLAILFLGACKKIRHELIPTRIEGTVIDILSGEPIPNAEITLWEGKRDFNKPVATAQTDDQGKFKIKYKFNLNDDSDGKWRYSVSAKKDGYYKKSTSAAEFDTNQEAIAQVEPTRANKHIILKLIPLTKAKIEIEDIAPYYAYSNPFNSLVMIINPVQTGTSSTSGVFGINKNTTTTIKIYEKICAGTYQFILYEKDYGGQHILKVKTFDVELKSKQENNIKLTF